MAWAIWKDGLQHIPERSSETEEVGAWIVTTARRRILSAFARRHVLSTARGIATKLILTLVCLVEILK
jgi:hypothetical protein